ncbi:hypothetical protein [Bacillus wiedmannii]|uniref:hypothetical protein n=1 Tax=Bacillus wiedmannii TaxID=1890302 RepID=UPI001145C4C5|nr:hypothetical protein [Bacillus wiedmannii]
MSVVKDNEFWKEVYYYMEEHDCYKDEAVEVIMERHKKDNDNQDPIYKAYCQLVNQGMSTESAGYLVNLAKKRAACSRGGFWAQLKILEGLYKFDCMLKPEKSRYHVCPKCHEYSGEVIEVTKSHPVQQLERIRCKCGWNGFWKDLQKRRV